MQISGKRIFQAEEKQNPKGESMSDMFIEISYRPVWLKLLKEWRE